MTEASDARRILVLVPDEVFLGDPVNEVTAVTNPTCLPGKSREIQVGDQWLFFLQSVGYRLTDQSATDLVLSFYSPSKPLNDAQDDIETLRRLARLTDTAIIAGKVERIGPTYDKLNPTPAPNHQIVVRSDTTGLEYTTYTNVNGHYEFELPPGIYEVAGETEQGFRVQDDFHLGGTYISNGACLAVDFRLLRDGKLAGRVTTAKGKPAKFISVSITRADPIGAPATVVTDETGHFELGGRQPGSYIIGVGLLAPYESTEWKSRVYYPGVRTKDEATIIQLGEGEWRTDIDFKLPPGR